ncbi:hypothetical protein F4775DRAFT_440150 [Biscogniauxia sp. FL1348]|nr:hypothetical protein F4775DRAFT_440150 [Biscogniauxia sp. FL1348]
MDFPRPTPFIPGHLRSSECFRDRSPSSTMPDLFKHRRSMMDRCSRHRQPQDDEPHRPNWVKRPSLLSPDVQPVVLEILNEFYQLPLDSSWHSAEATLAGRVFRVLSQLPPGSRPWCVAQVPEDFLAALSLVFRPGVILEVAGAVGRLTSSWCRKERSGAQVRRCHGRSFHPRVLFFNVSLAIMERVCQRCEREHPPSPNIDHDNNNTRANHLPSTTTNTIAFRATLYNILHPSSVPPSPPHRYLLGPVVVAPVKILRRCTDQKLDEIMRQNTKSHNRIVAWCQEHVVAELRGRKGRMGGNQGQGWNRGTEMKVIEESVEDYDYDYEEKESDSDHTDGGNTVYALRRIMGPL